MTGKSVFIPCGSEVRDAAIEPPITAVVTAYRRIAQTLISLQRLSECCPPPSEIIVHVDGREIEVENIIKQRFPWVRVIVSETNIGPGGGRNKLVDAATNEFVASFDDDSYPIDSDYFARIHLLMQQFPQASVLSAAVFHREEAVNSDQKTAIWASDFSGGACVYRRSAFKQTIGYVPLPIAYGMEEVDMALQLHERGLRILHSPWLRVYHDTDLRRHSDPLVTAASIKNIALLAYLRYPVSFWLVGAGQCLNRVLWLLRNNRTKGILRGLSGIPVHLFRNRRYRTPLCPTTIRTYLALRRAPIRAEWRDITDL